MCAGAAESDAAGRSQHGDPAAHLAALATAANGLHDRPLVLDAGLERCDGSQGEGHDHWLPVGTPVGEGLVAGVVGGARPQHVRAGGKRGVVDPREQPVALSFGGERLPAARSGRADLDRPVRQARDPIGHAHRDQGGIARR